MPKLQPGQHPKYRLHKQSGQAIVTLSGKDQLLGKHGSASSRQEYARLIGEWLASNGAAPPRASGATTQSLTIVQLVALFWRHAGTYYKAADGRKLAAEAIHYRNALRPVVKLYGPTPAAAFGPKALKAVRETMIATGWSRGFVNAQVNRIKRTFKWGVSEELVPPAVHQALATVKAIGKGRSKAPEAEPMAPVADDVLAATLPHLSPTIRAMVELQLLTGARPGELCGIRGDAIDQTDPKLWHVDVVAHKTAHHGHARTLYFGTKCQEQLRPYLLKCRGGFVFSPATAEAERRADAHAARTTPAGTGNAPGTNRVRKPQRVPGERYTVTTYRRAIARACEAAFAMPVELREPTTKAAIAADTPEARAARRKARSEWRAAHVWHPHQLRHNAATRLRSEFGLEAAQVILGHKTLSVTQLYAEKNVTAAKSIMSKIG